MQGCLLFVAFIYVLVNLVVDLLLSALRSAGWRPNENSPLSTPSIGGILIAACCSSPRSSARSGRPTIRCTLNFTARLQPPSPLYWLGTDEFGRDVLSRLMAAPATSVWISLLTVALRGRRSAPLIGLVTGYAARLDRPRHHGRQRRAARLSRHPAGAGLIAVFGANKYGIILALGLAYMPSVARVVRGAVLSLREKEFIEASRVMGNSEIFTMVRHVLPNCLAPMTVLATIDVRLGAAGGERAELPRPRRAAAGADLGQHAGRRAAPSSTRRPGSASSRASASR